MLVLSNSERASYAITWINRVVFARIYSYFFWRIMPLQKFLDNRIKLANDLCQELSGVSNQICSCATYFNFYSAIFQMNPDLSIYNPMTYAFASYREYVQKYYGTRKILFLGMNPGPHRKGRNGVSSCVSICVSKIKRIFDIQVPFGDTEYAIEFLGIENVDYLQNFNGSYHG